MTQKPEWRIQDKLQDLRVFRTKRLQQTDHLAVSDRTMSDEMKEWRKKLRDIPQDFTTEAEYDLLLKKDTDESSATFDQLTHSIWKKPS
tara:strand:- start:903 stop:1169 length:267 start_codon:yes stop_codon:yes gene_type:complete